MKSAGTSRLRINAKNSPHAAAPGRRDKTTSPVSESLVANTSLPSNLNSAGSRTAWLAPFLNSFATFVTRIAALP